jgi:hypothetical protein
MDQLRTSISINITKIASLPSILAFDGEDETASSSYQQSQPNLRRNKSSISLSSRLTHCVSAVYNQPTVIHRPNLASRPTILPSDKTQDTIHHEPPFGFNEQKFVSPDDVSIHANSSISGAMAATSTASTFSCSPGNGASGTWQTHHDISLPGLNEGMLVPSRVVIPNSEPVKEPIFPPFQSHLRRHLRFRSQSNGSQPQSLSPLLKPQQLRRSFLKHISTCCWCPKSARALNDVDFWNQSCALYRCQMRKSKKYADNGCGRRATTSVSLGH